MNTRDRKHDTRTAGRPRWTIILTGALVAAVVAAGGPAGAQDVVTPTPQLVPGNPCPAVVTLRWDVSGVPSANGVLWEVDDDGFSNPDGPEQDRLGFGTSGNLAGQAVIDLRELGRVLDGSRYLLRVVAKNGNQDVALRSAPVRFDLDRIPDGSFTAAAVPGQPGRIELDWSGLQPDIRACSEAVFWEIKEGSGFVFPGPDQTRDDAGNAPLGAGRALLDVTGLGGGPFFVRLVGKHGGLGYDSDVGRRGTGLRVDLAAPTPVPVAPEPPPVITGFEVGDPAVRAHVPGEVPFTFRATGSYDSYKVADCEVFDHPAVDFVSLNRGRNRFEVTLPAGERKVCLQLRRSTGLSETLSKRATDTIKISQPPDAPVVTGLILEADGEPASLVDVGDGVEPHVLFTGVATHFRIGPCIGFADRPWSIVPSRRQGELVLPAFSTGTEGLRDVCVQLARQVSGEPLLVSNTRNAQIEFVRRVVHEVPILEVASALELARRTGFSNSVEALDGDADCDVDREGGLVVIGGPCRFHLLAGRALNERWEVEEIRVLYDEESFSVQVDHEPSGRDAELDAVISRVETDGGGFVFPGAPLPPPRLVLRPSLLIRLRGPAESNWRRAFAN